MSRFARHGFAAVGLILIVIAFGLAAAPPPAEAAQTLRPRIVTTPPTASVVVGAKLVYRPRAAGIRPLRWSLSRGPRGMTVNRATGVLRWTPSVRGAFAVTLVVRNARGVARQRFRLASVGAELPNPIGPPSPPPAPPPPANVVLAAGDISSCANDNDEATARILDQNPLASVLTLGDNVYDSGSATEFSSCYAPTWGRHASRTYPAPGNHDFATSNAAGYFGFFGARAGSTLNGYYSFDIGAWHLISLNSERDVAASGAQVAWLRADLAATTKKCVLAYWHKPRFAAGSYSDFTQYIPFWEELYAARAEIVLNGHDHNYQRYRPMTPHGVDDATNGLRQFLVGTGGWGSYPLRADSRRDAAGTNIFGVLKLTLNSDSYDWTFLPAAGTTFADSGVGACR